MPDPKWDPDYDEATAEMDGAFAEIRRNQALGGAEYWLKLARVSLGAEITRAESLFPSAADLDEETIWRVAVAYSRLTEAEAVFDERFMDSAGVGD